MSDPEKPFDAGDPQAVKERNRSLKVQASERAKMIKAIMSLREGRAWIWELLTRCKVFHNSFSTNALVMAHNTGEQNIGQMILADISTKENFEYYQQMLKENSDAWKD